ncbi:hypothetical protein LCGC14_1575790 [marine sediment metagenome]|uniref:Uncharacterized protein n=1 Tax=marine sediment metagenome TaxID=412755 RepID=A0A0F9IIB6_9ZZZZ
MRTIDQRRIKAQIDLATRITKGGEIDMEQALREREALADRVGEKRAFFLAWLKKRGTPRHEIEAELRALDILIVQLRTPPFSRQSLGGLGRMLG